MIHHHRARGISLPEVVFGSAIAVLVVIASVALLGVTGRMRQSTESQLDPREVSFLAMAELREAFQDASEIQFDAGRQHFRFRTPRGSGEVFHEPRARRILLRRPGEDRTHLLGPAGRAVFAVQVLRPGLVRLHLLLLPEQDDRGRIRAVTVHRVHDVLMPVARRDPRDSPWNPLPRDPVRS
jgi:hypothetical protein